jgi:predicted nucleic acid-binding protein
VALIYDTGPLYAAMDQADRDHAACVELFTSSAEPLVVPALVVVELDWLVSSRLGAVALQALVDNIQEGTIRIAELTRADYARIRELYGRYRDLPLGFVDAAVLAVVERLGERKLATLDHRHFRIVQPRHTPALTLLPDIVRA